MEGEIYRSIEEILETGPWTRNEQDQLEEFLSSTSSDARPQTNESNDDRNGLDEERE